VPLRSPGRCFAENPSIVVASIARPYCSRVPTNFSQTTHLENPNLNLSGWSASVIASDRSSGFVYAFVSDCRKHLGPAAMHLECRGSKMLRALVVRFLVRPLKHWRERCKASELAIAEARLFYLARFDPDTLTELFG